MPLYSPTEAKVAKFVETVRATTAPTRPCRRARSVPTIQALAANAVMAGCKPEYFPVATARCAACSTRVQSARHARDHAFLRTDGHGERSDPQGAQHQLRLELLRPGLAGQRHDRPRARPDAAQRRRRQARRDGPLDPGQSAKYTFCFGENEEENPWTPYHVQRGFAPTDSVVTVMSGEGPHNLNDHGSTTGIGLLTTFAGGMANPGANTIYGKGPMFVIIGPEHAATLKRDGFTIESIREELWKRSRVHPVARLEREPRDLLHHRPQAGRRLAERSPQPDDIHITVAGGPGKHSAFIPSFGGTTVASVRIAQ
jgi:hypothetical protein